MRRLIILYVTILITSLLILPVRIMAGCQQQAEPIPTPTPTPTPAPTPGSTPHNKPTEPTGEELKVHFIDIDQVKGDLTNG